MASKRRARPRDLRWQVDLSKLDFEHYIPIFCGALDDTEHPYETLARDGVIQMLQMAGDRVLSVLPEVVRGLKKALITEDPRIIMNACMVLQTLATVSPLVSMALIKYYRVLLIPVFSKYKTVQQRFHRGEIYYGQRFKRLCDVINDTLNLLDRTGGFDAYVEIKYAVPTFDSIYHNY